MGEQYLSYWRQEDGSTSCSVTQVPLDLFAPSGLRPMARTSDPETSKAAARRQDRDTLLYQWDMIVNALREHGQMNYSQLDVSIGWDHPRAARRLHELVDKKRIRATGDRTLTHTGSPAAVYEAM